MQLGFASVSFGVGVHNKSGNHKLRAALRPVEARKVFVPGASKKQKTGIDAPPNDPVKLVESTASTHSLVFQLKEFLRINMPQLNSTVRQRLIDGFRRVRDEYQSAKDRRLALNQLYQKLGLID